MARCGFGPCPAVFGAFRDNLLDHKRKSGRIWFQFEAESTGFHSQAYVWSWRSFRPAHVFEVHFSNCQEHTCGYPQTSLVSFLGNMTFQWIVVGLSEETMFRGLIQTYLMINLSGYVRILSHDLHVGTVIGAVIWGLFHFINILVMPLGPVVFTVVLTTMAGLLMGYAYQETGSLMTTIIVHNTMFGVPLTIGYILYWLL